MLGTRYAEKPIELDGLRITPIPVDHVVNAMLAVAAHPPTPEQPGYYHVSSGSRNPLQYLGLYRYVFKLGGPPHTAPFLQGSAAAGFTAFIGGDNSQQQRQMICEALPQQLRDLLPLCQGGP